MRSVRCNFDRLSIKQCFKKYKPKMLFDSHLAYFATRTKIHPLAKKIEATGIIENLFTVVTSKVTKCCH